MQSAASALSYQPVPKARSIEPYESGLRPSKPYSSQNTQRWKRVLIPARAEGPGLRAITGIQG